MTASVFLVLKVKILFPSVFPIVIYLAVEYFLQAGLLLSRSMSSWLTTRHTPGPVSGTDGSIPFFRIIYRALLKIPCPLTERAPIRLRFRRGSALSSSITSKVTSSSSKAPSVLIVIPFFQFSARPQHRRQLLYSFPFRKGYQQFHSTGPPR